MNAEAKFIQRIDRILAMIEAEPGISARDLNLKTQSIRVDERKELIDELVNDGKIRVETDDSRRGRPKTTYWPEVKVPRPKYSGNPTRVADEISNALSDYREECKRKGATPISDDAFWSKCWKDLSA